MPDAFRLVRQRRVASMLISLIVAVALLAVSNAAEPAAADDQPTGGAFVASQGRLIDTRVDTWAGAPPGTAPALMTANSWRPLQVGGRFGVPTSGVSAVSITIVAVAPGSSGNVDAAPDGASTTFAQSFLNYTVDRNASNTGVVAVSDSGRIKLKASTSINLIVDLQGYFTAGDPGAGGFVPVAPTRLVDSRNGTGTRQGVLPPDTTVAIQAGGIGGVSPDASSVVVNLTAVDPTGPGRLRTGSAASSVGLPVFFPEFHATSITTIVPLSRADETFGKFKVTVEAATSHLLVDVVGYYVPGTVGGGFTPSRTRAIDTRIAPAEPLGAESATAFQVAGVGDVPLEDVNAVALHITAIAGSAGGALRVWPSGQPAPSTSTSALYYTANRTISNLVIAEIGPDGKVRVHNGGSLPIDIVIDIEGWYSEVTPDPDDPYVLAPEAAETSYGVDEHELEDLQAVADDVGMSLQDAVDRWGWTPEFSAAVEELETQYPTSFAWADVNPTVTNSGTVAFKGATPNGVASALADVDVPITVIGGQPYSQAEQVEFVEEASAGIEYELSDDSIGMTSSFDIDANRISVEIETSPEETDPAQISQLVNAANQGMEEANMGKSNPPSPPNVDVSIDYSVGQVALLRGGARIGNDNRWLCTSGFPARDRNDPSIQGLLTADHCQDNIRRYGANQRQRLTVAARHLPRRWGDIQFHRRDGEAVVPEFHRGPSDIARMKPYLRALRGEPICMFGRTTMERRCGIVHRVGVRRRYSGTGEAGGVRDNLTWVRESRGDPQHTVHRALAHPGDSGGPSFYGGRPIGLISGSSCLPPADDPFACVPPDVFAAYPNGGLCVRNNAPPVESLCRWWAFVTPLTPIVRNVGGMNLSLLRD